MGLYVIALVNYRDLSVCYSQLGIMIRVFNAITQETEAGKP